MVQCAIATFFNMQDLTKDSFLVAKMIISLGGWIFWSDLSTFGALVRV